jgi:hypothetical protein
VNRPLAVLRRATAVLDGLGIPYAIGGSLASTLYGESRSSMDFDLIVELPPALVEPLARSLEGSFYLDRGAMLEAVRERRAFNAIDLDTGFKLDLFVRGDAPFDLEEFRRRRLQPPGDDGTPLQFKSPEDTVLRKLQWYRSGGSVSELQWRDVLGVLRVSGAEMDRRYLAHWSRELGVSDLLERALDEAAHP